MLVVGWLCSSNEEGLNYERGKVINLRPLDNGAAGYTYNQLICKVASLSDPIIILRRCTFRRAEVRSYSRVE